MPPQLPDARAPEAPPRAVLDGFVALLYERLRVMAHQRLRFAPGEASLNTTGLVHEAYLRLAEHPDRRFADRAHFLALASRVMRNVLVDHARARASQKRAGAVVELSPGDGWLGAAVDLDRVVDLDDALRRLDAVDPRQCRLVECRYFGGLTLEETAAALDVSLATAKRELRLARAWLAANLEAESA
jgi:RNA polymerase sigma factor (TIGR02999 family)